ncbi:hypothetical protein [Pontibacillus yanchengensis]|nr:hypothetical protein [Pontibacillus yanchengensis]
MKELFNVWVDTESINGSYEVIFHPYAIIRRTQTKQTNSFFA